jgi:hypothetical protein
LGALLLADVDFLAAAGAGATFFPFAIGCWLVGWMNEDKKGWAAEMWNVRITVKVRLIFYFFKKRTVSHGIYIIKNRAPHGSGRVWGDLARPNPYGPGSGFNRFNLSGWSSSFKSFLSIPFISLSLNSLNLRSEIS